MNTAKKEIVKIIAVALSGVIAGTALTAAALNTAKKENDAENTVSAAEKSESTESKALSKDETVYVLSGADGSVKKIIVSDWVKSGGNKTVKDKTELDNIKNVKGDETYTIDKDNMKLWETGGNDIYYRGTTEKSLPVDLKVSFKLDGKAVSADEIKGKSGRATIRFDYENNEYTSVKINGKNEKIYVPFLMLTGLILDNDGFKNVEITNGKIINDGDRTVAVGFALPGMQESLGLDRETLEIPSFVEISADVSDFSLGATLTLAANSPFNEINTEKLNSADDLKANINELVKATDKLIDGSATLYDGLGTLLLKSRELAAGAGKLADGAADLANGTAALSAGLKELTSNSAALNGGAKQVFDTLLSTVTAQLKQNGIETEALTPENYKTVLEAVINNPALKQLPPAKAEVLKATVGGALKQLDSYNEFYKGVIAYTAGAESAYKGSEQLKNGAATLKDGTNTLKSGTDTLVSGVSRLSSGAKQLSDGIKEFNEKGIARLKALSDNELTSLTERIKATVNVSKSYKAFAGTADGTDGEVKFIYKTDEID